MSERTLRFLTVCLVIILYAQNLSNHRNEMVTFIDISAPNVCSPHQQHQCTSEVVPTFPHDVPPASSPLAVEICYDNFQCCICLDIFSKNNTILRSVCLHRLCSTCSNTKDYIRLSKSDNCLACQKDLDETVSNMRMD